MSLRRLIPSVSIALPLAAAIAWLTAPLPAPAQIPGTANVQVGGTNIIGGTSGRCLFDNAGKVGETASCGLAGGVTVGTSVITGGTTTRVLFDNAGVVGEYTAAALSSFMGLGTASTQNTGTSGAAVPLLNGNNTWSGTQAFNGQITTGSTVIFANTIGNANGTNPLCWNSGTGAVTFATSACTASDARLKTNVKPLARVLPKLRKMQGVRFDWRDKAYGTKRQIGVIADWFEADWPELVSKDDRGLRAFDYQKFTAVLLQAINEQQAEIDALRKRVH